MAASRLSSHLLALASMDTSRASPGAKGAVMAARVARRILLAAGMDRPSRVRVRGMDRPILLPLSHQMPLYRSMNARYDTLIDELADHIRQREPLAMVDVGANVGDSILSANPQPGDAFLAFEPHPYFLAYLHENTAGLDGVIISAMACGADEGVVVLGDAANGTASSGPTIAGRYRVSAMSLDTAVSTLWAGVRPNFIKIDTDGFDVDVLDGARQLLSRQSAWLFYEFDHRLTKGGIDRHIGALRMLRECGFESAAAFRNTGEFVKRLELRDEAAWRRLLATQSAGGPIYFHDLLLAPSEADLAAFLETIPGGNQSVQR